MKVSDADRQRAFRERRDAKLRRMETALITLRDLLDEGSPLRAIAEKGLQA